MKETEQLCQQQQKTKAPDAIPHHPSFCILKHKKHFKMQKVKQHISKWSEKGLKISKKGQK
ncbi:MAG: hypothetical protein K2Y32_16935 [Candidatus Obscuribacterales bacterium]|nr:hypothetical protein [Candidatus Obscuribacterales bacterium]MBX9940949.1 hypothetical protein [Candidatus Obscuribacterales bacterium]